jgi:nucleotide-binding universal stress UspA family protein
MKILLAYDGSDHADKAVARAAMITDKLHAELVVIAVAPDLCLPSTELSMEQCDDITKAFARETEGDLKKALDTLSSKGITPKTVIESGEPVDNILKTAAAIGADLIVLGSRGRRGAKRMLLGSVSSKVAEYANCDVLIVK